MLQSITLDNKELHAETKSYLIVGEHKGKKFLSIKMKHILPGVILVCIFSPILTLHLAA